MASVWKLLYSLDEHGASLHTLYAMTREYVGPCVWMMKDEEGQVGTDERHHSSSFFLQLQTRFMALIQVIHSNVSRIHIMAQESGK